MPPILKLNENGSVGEASFCGEREKDAFYRIRNVQEVFGPAFTTNSNRKCFDKLRSIESMVSPDGTADGRTRSGTQKDLKPFKPGEQTSKQIHRQKMRRVALCLRFYQEPLYNRRRCEVRE